MEQSSGKCNFFLLNVLWVCLNTSIVSTKGHMEHFSALLFVNISPFQLSNK